MKYGPFFFQFGIFASAFSTSTVAQGMGGNSSQEETGGLSEIVVTAQKRSENLQKVPIAIAAVSAEQLVQTGVTSTENLSIAIPGLSILNVGGILTPRIRGVGTTATAAGVESPVAVYVDGVYYAFGADVNVDTADVTRVDVLKGPQGTLFGRNATGGVIQFNTREPTDDFEISLVTGIDNYLTSRSNLFVGGELTDELKGSFSVSYATQGKGWGNDITDGRDIHRIHHDVTLRGKLIYMGELTTAKLIVDYNSQANDLSLNFRTFQGGPVFGNPPQPRRKWDSNNYQKSLYNHDGGGASITIDHDMDFAHLISISAYRSATANLLFNAPPSPVPESDLNIPERSRQFTQELQLVSKTGGNFSWVAGLYYYWNDAQLSPVTVNLYPTLTPPPLIIINNDGRQKSNSISGFVQGTFSVTPKTRITAGLRYTYEKKDFRGSTFTTFAGTDGPRTVVPGHASFKRPTWRLSIDQDLARNFMAYASYNRGFKSGGFNTSSFSNPAFLPEKLDAYEVGFKSELFDRSVRFNLAGFYYRYTNIQINRFVTTAVIYNGKGAENYGIDADMEAQLSSRFKINANLSWLHATFLPGTVGQTSTVIPGNLGILLGTGPIGGNRLPNSPDITFVIGVDYTFPTSVGDFTFNVTDSYSDGFYGEPDNRLFQESFNYLNMSLSWRADGPLGIRLWGNNLLNKAVANQIVSLSPANSPDGFGSGYFASYSMSPRTYGVTMSAKF